MISTRKRVALMKDDFKTILDRPTCTVEEFRKIVRLSRNSAYDAVRRGDVEVIRHGRLIRVITAPLKVKLGLGQ
jgi:hypothetical protein